MSLSSACHAARKQTRCWTYRAIVHFACAHARLVLKIDLKPAASDNTTVAAKHSLHETVISPFVLAVSQARIPVLPDLMNGVIVVAVFSMANASSK